MCVRDMQAHGEAEVHFECECGHKWQVTVPVVSDHGEEVEVVGLFDDVCDGCGMQCDPKD